MVKILVVDDEIDVTEQIKMDLEDLRPEWNIVCRNSGYQALKYINENRIDLLLSDIAMPDMDGYELYKRAKDIRKKLPIILMTAFGYDPGHVVVNCKKNGLKDVIFKPFSTNKLYILIKKRLGLC